MNDIVIRPATEDDISAVAELQQQWHDEDITWGLMPDTQEELLAYVRGYCQVAQLGRRLVGVATARLLPEAGIAALPAGRPCLEFMDVYVIPSLRSRGIGGRLVDSLLDRAKTAGIEAFKLWSSTKDIPRVVSFYERHGFGVVGVQMVRGELS
jgi:GNAT superfamily N-acetyltransferase